MFNNLFLKDILQGVVAHSPKPSQGLTIKVLDHPDARNNARKELYMYVVAIIRILYYNFLYYMLCKA